MFGTKSLGTGSTYIYTYQDARAVRSVRNASFPVCADVILFGKEPGTRTEWHVTMWRAKYITVTENEPHSHKEILFITGNIV